MLLSLLFVSGIHPANSFAQLVSSVPLGYLSNRWGRKPVILIGNVACFLGMLWFGLSDSYAVALSSRVFAGLFNGILGAWKCIIGESGDSLLQGKECIGIPA